MIKKIMMTLTLAVVACSSAWAAAGDFSVAGQFAFASKNSLFGLGAQAQLEVVKNVRIAPEFIYYFENNHQSAINVNANVHYLIHTYSNQIIYPMAGFSYTNFKYDKYNGDYNEDRCGANVGCGYEYSINPNFTFYTEQRFQILKDHNQWVSVLGIKYTF